MMGNPKAYELTEANAVPLFFAHEQIQPVID